MYFVLFLCVVALTISSTDACSCLQPPHKATYEAADFVLFGKIRQIKKTELQLWYKVSLRRVFKGANLFGEKKFWLSTGNQDGLCGVTNLKPGQVYLLSGKAYNGTFSFSSCGYFKLPRPQVSKESVQLDQCKIPLKKFLRKPDFKCRAKKCPLNQVWNNRCKSCPKICPHFDQKICTCDCRAGCECPKSAPFSHPATGKCVTHTECEHIKHCVYGGKKYLLGQKIDQFCSCTTFGVTVCA